MIWFPDLVHTMTSDNQGFVSWSILPVLRSCFFFAYSAWRTQGTQQYIRGQAVEWWIGQWPHSRYNSMDVNIYLEEVLDWANGWWCTSILQRYCNTHTEHRHSIRQGNIAGNPFLCGCQECCPSRTHWRLGFNSCITVDWAWDRVKGCQPWVIIKLGSGWRWLYDVVLIIKP